MQKIIQFFFIAFVITVLFFPFLFAHREENRIAEDENRYYANVPVLWEDGKINPDYISEFEAWIDDNARLRTVFRELKVSLLYRVFGVLEQEDIGAGKNGSLYGVSQAAVELFQGRNLLSGDQLKEYENALYNLQEWLEAQDVDFYFMTCYDKITILQEGYPTGVVIYDTPHIGQQTEEYIVAANRVNIVPLYDILKENAGNNIYYQYIDSCHWNDAGMYLGYESLMRKIQEKYPHINYLQKQDYEITTPSRKHYVYGFEYPLEEEYPSYAIRQINAIETDIDIYNELYYKEHTHYFENETGSERVLVINDSFVRMGMKNSLAESFEETLSIDLGNLTRLEWLMEEYQPQIVILECVEGNILSVISMLNEMNLQQ